MLYNFLLIKIHIWNYEINSELRIFTEPSAGGSPHETSHESSLVLIDLLPHICVK